VNTSIVMRWKFTLFLLLFLTNFTLGSTFKRERLITVPKIVHDFIDKIVDLYEKFFALKWLITPPIGIFDYATAPPFYISEDYYNIDKPESFPNDLNVVTAIKDANNKEKSPFWLFDRFAEKTDLFLMTTVLLKLIVFKKIIKFIALIALLFFVPSLTETITKSDDSRSLDIYGKIF
jgi:hypothetical protein